MPGSGRAEADPIGDRSNGLGPSCALAIVIALALTVGWTAAPAAAASDVTGPADETSGDVGGVRPDRRDSRRASARETERELARFVVTRQPKRSVHFGTPISVTAILIAEGGVRMSGQVVDLRANVRASKQWRRVASGITDDRGRVTLHSTLRASARLHLRHRGAVIVAPEEALRSVVVSKRITVDPGRTRTRVGMSSTVRGKVAPNQPIGSKVWLQRRTGGSWIRVAAGEMVGRDRFAIRWTATRPGRYVFRAVRPWDAHLAAGVSAPWHQRVDPETTADIARDILRDDGITLERGHPSDGSYLGSAHQNVRDIARGFPARHSCHGGAPCDSTRVDRRVLEAVRDMGRHATLTVSEFAGGVHAPGSTHYSGRAVDITWVNKRHVGAGARYDVILKICRKHGASRIFHPSHDPYGGHQYHIHCDWKPAKRR